MPQRPHWILIASLLLLALLAGCGGGGSSTSSGVLVNIQEPLNNKSYNQGQSVTLQAFASSSTANIDHVTYTATDANNNTTTIGTAPATAAPTYQVVWNTTTVAAGAYTITATATDTSSPAKTGTATIKVTIIGVAVSFTAPLAANRTVTVGTNVTVTATASAQAGIANVAFTVNGIALGTVLSSPYTVPWPTTGLAAGSYTIVAKASDNSSPAQTASASITILEQSSASAPPGVQITTPHTGTQVTGTVGINFTAQANTTGATITKVVVTMGTLSQTITGNGTALLTSSASLDTTAISDGTYTVTAQATDSNSLATSTSISLTVSNNSGPPPPPF